MAQTFEILMLGGRNNIRHVFVKLRIHEAREAADILQKNQTGLHIWRDADGYVN